MLALSIGRQQKKLRKQAGWHLLRMSQRLNNEKND